MTKLKLFSSMAVLILSIYSVCSIQSSNAQTANWKRYDDNRFSFSYPPEWNINGTRHYDNGVTETILTNPNSSRMKVSLVYNPKDSSLNSQGGRPVTLTNVLKVIEDQIAVDYINFSSTGKFPHRYSIQNHPSVSDVVDYEKVKGRTGKMLLLYSKVSDTDTLQFTYAESKRSFYKQLPIVSTVIKSVIIK